MCGSESDGITAPHISPSHSMIFDGLCGCIDTVRLIVALTRASLQGVGCPPLTIPLCPTGSVQRDVTELGAGSGPLWLPVAHKSSHVLCCGELHQHLSSGSDCFTFPLQLKKKKFVVLFLTQTKENISVASHTK